MKALLFDIDDTLYDLSWPFRMAYLQMFEKQDDIYLTQLFKAFRKHSDEVFEKSQSGEISMEEMYCYRIQKAFKDFGRELTKEEALNFQELYQDFQKKIELSPVIELLLEKLSKKWILGAITNGSYDHQMEKIERLGLEQYIPEENIFISGDVGLSKPDKEIFKYAASSLSILPEDCYYIGDTYENDIEGSRSAGMTPIWFNRRNYKNKEIKFTVDSEEELKDLLLDL